jgi:ABC-2 type transport system permease protein
VTALRWTVRVLRYDQLTFWRVPAAVFFTVGMPVLMLTIFGSLNQDEGIEAATCVPYTRYLVLGLVAFAIGTTAYGNMAARTTFRREMGIYQRLRTTPLPVPALVVGQIVSAVLALALVISVLLVVGVLWFEGTAPKDWPLFLAVLLLGTAACCAIGMAVSTFVPSVETIDPIVFATMLPVAFISGSFQHVGGDGWVARLADLFPLRHILQVVLRSFSVPGAVGSTWVHLAVVAAWGVGGALVAVRRFRWS